MIKPFHLSFSVANLEEVKTFYTKSVGCMISEDHGTWVNIIFFGHQLTIHQSTGKRSIKNIDHFGPILEKKEWLEILKRCQLKAIGFEMAPLIKSVGKKDESGKYIIKDPAGNLLEFKYYLDKYLGVKADGINS